MVEPTLFEQRICPDSLGLVALECPLLAFSGSYNRLIIAAMHNTDSTKLHRNCNDHCNSIQHTVWANHFQCFLYLFFQYLVIIHSKKLHLQKLKLNTVFALGTCFRYQQENISLILVSTAFRTFGQFSCWLAYMVDFVYIFSNSFAYISFIFSSKSRHFVNCVLQCLSCVAAWPKR